MNIFSTGNPRKSQEKHLFFSSSRLSENYDNGLYLWNETEDLANLYTREGAPPTNSNKMRNFLI